MTKFFSPWMAVFCPLLILLLTGCSSDNAIQQLLTNVPADCRMCAVIRSGELASKTGLEKSDKGGVVLPEKFLSNVDSEYRDIIQFIANDGAGTDLEATILFEMENGMMLFGRIDNEKTFREDMKKFYPGKEFVKTGDVEILENVAVADGKYWISERAPITAAIVGKLLNLSKEESLADSPTGTRLAGCKDMGFLFGPHYVTGQGGEPEVGMMLAYAVEDPRSVFIDMEFSNGVAEAGFELLNSKGEEATLALPMEKIDTSVLRRLGNTGSLVFAVSLPSKLVSKVLSFIAGSGLNLNLPIGDEGLRILSAIDGTAAAGTGATLPAGVSSATAPLSLALTLKGKDAASAAEALGSLVRLASGGTATTSFSDNVFTANTAPAGGASALGPHFNELDGASAGLLVNFDAVSTVPAGVYDYLALRIEAGGKAKGSAKLYMKARNRNSLASIIAMYSK